ncbi:MAG TPA: ribose-5-phosphate isomerase A, partial [Pirellulaceae bacterium]
MRNVERALQYVQDGMILGLGSGRASERFLAALADRVRAGLNVRGIPTSESIARQARELGIPLVEFERAGRIDLAIDGADEVDPSLNLIKGYGR